MSLTSRFQGYLLSKKYPLFTTMRRSLDIGDKGKAEENAYFRKEQWRLLERLKRALMMSKPKPDATQDKPIKPTDQKEEKK